MTTGLGRWLHECHASMKIGLQMSRTHTKPTRVPFANPGLNKRPCLKQGEDENQPLRLLHAGKDEGKQRPLLLAGLNVRKSLLSYLVLLLEHQVAPAEMYASAHKTRRFFADALGLLHPQ